jgi:hypothetical protein
MAKQPSESGRPDSSAGRGAATVSGNTDTIAAAEPSAFADARTTLLSDVRDMHDVCAQLVADPAHELVPRPTDFDRLNCGSA